MHKKYKKERERRVDNSDTDLHRLQTIGYHKNHETHVLLNPESIQYDYAHPIQNQQKGEKIVAVIH